MAVIIKPEFISKKEAYTTADQFKYSKAWMTGYRRVICYVIRNCTSNPVIVKLQISPEADTWLNDHEQLVVPGNASVYLAPNFWCKYIRVAFKSAKKNRPSKITLMYTAQS